MEMKGKIGFIGGGRMAEALIKGVLQAGLTESDHILVVDPEKSRRDLLHEVYNVSTYQEGNVVWQKCDIVILAVKPQIIGTLLEDCRKDVAGRHLIISIAAGVPLASLESGLAGTGCRIIRVMPNTPAIIQEGASALSAGSRAQVEDMDIARRIFEAVGKCVVLDERYLDAVTGLSGSGPAYVFSFIEALIDAGLKVGLNRPDAEVLAMQTLLGSVKLAMESKEHPAQLRAMVTSPGGTTIEGLYELEKAGFHGIIMNAVAAATKRSRELGQKTTCSK